MGAASGCHPADPIEKHAERLAVRALEGSDAARGAAAEEILHRVPRDASGKLRAFRLCALGVRDGASEPHAEAAAILDEPIWQARLLRSRGVLACRAGRLDEGGELLRRALDIIREGGFARLEPQVLLNLGIVKEAQGDPEEGLALMQEARRLFARQGDRGGEGAALASSGPVYLALGANPEAIEALVEGTALLDGAGRDPVRCNALANLARAYTRAGVREEAIRCAAEARKLAQPGSASAIWALTALAHVHSDAGDHDAAIEAGTEAVAAARGSGREYLLMFALLSLGDAQRVAGRLAEAGETYRSGSALAERMDILDLRIGYRLGLAYVLEREGDIAGGLALAEPLLEPAERYGKPSSLMELHETLSRLREAAGDAGTALEHLRRAQALRARIFTRESEVRARKIDVAQRLRRERERTSETLRKLTRRVMESQEEERRRVARDLHDDLGQHLALLAVELDMLQQAPPASSQETSAALGALAERARSFAGQVHAICHQLHPGRLSQLGLAGAVQAVCEEIERAHGIRVEFSADVARRVPDDVALCLYRVLQEGLSNAVRHGRAARASVRLAAFDDEIRLAISDEGVGFDPELLESPGIGLAGMRERAHHLHGRFELRSRPGQGTQIEVVLPLEAAGDA